MKTLKQILYNYEPIRLSDVNVRENIIKAFKEWLEATHKEMTEKIQYEELYIEEVIPFLVKRLER